MPRFNLSWMKTLTHQAAKMWNLLESDVRKENLSKFESIFLILYFLRLFYVSTYVLLYCSEALRSVQYRK